MLPWGHGVSTAVYPIPAGPQMAGGEKLRGEEEGQASTHRTPSGHHPTPHHGRTWAPPEGPAHSGPVCGFVNSTEVGEAVVQAAF